MPLQPEQVREHQVLRALLRSQGWKVVMAEFERRREGRMRDLVSSDASDEDRRLYAAEIRAFDSVVLWPKRRFEDLDRRVKEEVEMVAP